MTWANFYFACFAVGFFLSLLSFLAGSLHWHLHFPHFPPHAGGAHAHVGGHGQSAGAGARPVVHASPFNFASIAAFLAWFGGMGYLLTRYSAIWFVFGLGIAVLSGASGAAIVYTFLTRVLMSDDENLDPADYEMAGVLGRTSVPVRPGGTGEIIYSQGGTRRTCGARSEDSVAIPKGSEVMVMRYEKGIAYVRLWKDVSGEEPAPGEDIPPQLNEGRN